MSTSADYQRGEGIARLGNYSSSPGLSSPPSPHSPTNATTPTVLSDHITPVLRSQYGDEDVDVDRRGANLDLAKNGKKPRKKREPKIKGENGKSSTTTVTDGKEHVPKVRKPRNPPGTSSSTVGRKKKVVDLTETRFGQGQNLPRQTKVATTNPTQSSLPSLGFNVPAHVPSQPQNGNHEAIARSIDLQPIMSSNPRPTSGQNYDPIRSSTIEPRKRSPQNQYKVLPRSGTPTGTPTRPPAPRYPSASASPSIASLIDAPNPSHDNIYPVLPKHTIAKAPSPTAKRPRLSPPVQIYPLLPKTSKTEDTFPTTIPTTAHYATGRNDVDVIPLRVSSSKSASLMKKPRRATSTGPSSTSHSPKPSRLREAPVPSGNGLLSSTIFGGTDEGTALEKSAPTVILNVPLNGSSNVVVNFAELAEKKYGFNALHPRLAAQSERLAKVAAAGAALENAQKAARQFGSGISADEMSVDLSDHDGGADDSNVEMGGTALHDREGGGLGPSGSEGGIKKKVPKKRVMKEDQYDKDDPFVDDTELAWEEQAAASRDGFFVYSGPLVPEGEKANVEKADGVSKRGRGKGRGGSTRGAGRGGAAATGAASTRAAPVVRKPRVTKAAKILMEQEKVHRETMATLAAKPRGYPG